MITVWIRRRFLRSFFLTWISVIFLISWTFSSLQQLVISDTSRHKQVDLHQTLFNKHPPNRNKNSVFVTNASPHDSHLNNTVIVTRTSKRQKPNVEPKHSNLIQPSKIGHFSELADDVTLFSAYYDNRLEDDPKIRLPVIIRTALQTKRTVKAKFQHNLFCVFRYKTNVENNQSETVNTTTNQPIYNAPKVKRYKIRVQMEFYEMCENHQQNFGGYLLSCAVPTRLKFNLTEATLSIFDKRSSQSREIQIIHPLSKCETNASDTNVGESPSNSPAAKIEPINNSQQRINYAVCIHSPIFGKRYSTEYLAEYIELQLSIGTQHLIVYVTEDQSFRGTDGHELLKFYERRGDLTMIPWNIDSVTPAGFNQIWYNGQLIAIQDCLYRSMAAGIRYVAFNDLDEIMTPNNPHLTNVPQALDELWREYPDACGFRVTPELHEAPEKVASSIFHSKIGHHVQSNRHWKQLTKPIVRPELIFEVGVHHISKQLHEINRAEYATDTTLVLQHHSAKFRPMNYRKNDKESKKVFGVEYIGAFEQKVKENVKMILDVFRDT